MSNATDISLFQQLHTLGGNHATPIECTKATLTHISHALEDIVLAERLPALLFTGFQDAVYWHTELQRYNALATVAHHITIFAGGTLPPSPQANTLHIQLPPDAPLCREWFILVCSAEGSVVVCGLERSSTREEEDRRRFTTIFSFEHALIHQALNALELVIHDYQPEQLDQLRRMRAAIPVREPHSRIITSLLNTLFKAEAALSRHIHYELAERRRLDQALVARLRQQEMLTELGREALAATDIDTLLQNTVQLVAQTLAVEYCKVLELLPGEDSLLLRAGVGWRPGSAGMVRVDSGMDSQAGYTLASDAPVIVSNLQTETRFRGPALLHEHGVVSGISVVIWGNERPFGVLGAHTTTARIFNENDTNFLQTVAHILAAALERARLEDERRMIDRQLLETQKLESLGVLASGIAHDFNNLLTIILGNAELALLDLPFGALARESITAVISGAKRAAELTNQMLAYSGSGSFIIQPVQLNDLLRELGELLRVSVRRNCTVHYELAQDLPLIEADIAQLRQVVLNLLINASEAIGEAEGTITITTGTEMLARATLAQYMFGPELPAGQYVSLRIADTGSGMDTATVARIFEPFYTTKFAGRGLGLSAVQGIVRGHHGALQVFSTPGVGTTFQLWFPTAAVTALLFSRNEQGLQTQAERGSILVIDDEEFVRTVTTRLLERLNFTVYTAYDGVMGLKRLREGIAGLEVVLLDLTMPHMRGDAVARAIQTLRPGLPVILMSGYSTDEIAEQYADLELAGFLQKPFTIEALRLVLDRAIGVAR